MSRIFWTASAAVVCAFASPAVASVGQPVPGVYNTGVAADGTTVLAAGTTDPHYTMSYGSTAATQGSASPAPVTNYNNGFYSPPGSGSAWLGDAAFDEVGQTGVYDFTTTFDLSGFNPVTAVLTGSVLTDDSVQVFLNGNLVSGLVGGVPAVAGSSFYSNSAFDFSTNSGFVNGVNTLLFQNTNASGPFGIDVYGLSVHAAASTANGAVPEPATWAMMLLGFGAIGFALRRKRSSQALAQLA